MSHGHAHLNTDPGTMFRRLGFSITATFLFVLGEAVAGYSSHSLALLSDAGHNLADGLALILTWYGLWVAGKPSNSKRTYGSHRVSILAALVNAVSLVVIALVIFWEASVRLRAAEPINSTLMIWVALAAAIMNGIISMGLHHGAKDDLNVRGAYLHMLGDAISAFGVVAAGIFIRYTGSSAADSIVSFLIGGLILWSSWEILVDAVNILLEGAPKGLDMAGVEQSIRGVDGVLDIHDLHVWTLASGIVACSCHIQVSEQSIRSGQQVLAKVVDILRQRFSISHTTVQIEVEGCAPNDMYCTIRRLHRAGHDHNH